MTSWSDDDLAHFGGAGEVTIITLRSDGTARRGVPIWLVRVGADLYVRSWRGSAGSWFRNASRDPHGRLSASGITVDVLFEPAGDDARAAIDQAYRAKYGSGRYVDAMITPEAAACGLRLTPDTPSG
jgi:hypothetical protein